MSIAIDPDQVQCAADAFAGKVAPAVDSTAYTLARALGLSGAMAGHDDAGRTWSAAYDGAVDAVMGVGADVTNGSYRLAGLLQMTWGNHVRADDCSRPGGGNWSGDSHPDDYGRCSVRAYAVPAAAGGSNHEPRGWSLVRSCVGYIWPGGHQDRLREAGQAWGRAATAMSDASLLVTPAVTALTDQRSPEMSSAITVSRAMQTHICDLSNAYTNLQNACNDYADFLDRAHHDAENELASLVKWTVGIESAGAVLSVVSAGISEASAQVVEAGRISATAARIADIIRTLIAAAKGVGETIGAAVTRVVEISRKLKVLLGARMSRAAADEAAKLPGEAPTAEALAESRLLDASDKLKASLAWAVRPARMEHVLQNARHEHGLEGLIAASGGREAAMENIIRSVGRVPDGIYGRGEEIVRTIAGFRVLIRGRMVDGVFKISTAFVPK